MPSPTSSAKRRTTGDPGPRSGSTKAASAKAGAPKRSSAKSSSAKSREAKRPTSSRGASKGTASTRGAATRGASKGGGANRGASGRGRSKGGAGATTRPVRSRDRAESRSARSSEVEIELDLVEGGRATASAPTGRDRRGRNPFVRLRRQRLGGPVPFVPPASRAGRAFRLRRLERRGFVPLSPGRPRLHHRILPRTVIGISFMLFAFGLGAAFSGAAFYAYYDERLAENEESVARFVEGFDQQFTDATGALDTLRIEAIDDIRDELSPLGDYVDDANGVIGLPATAGESVWHLQTRDEAGELLNGAAFAVARHDGGTAFVTSYSLITASIAAPNPAIELVKGDERLSAQLWTWDVDYDLAVIVVDEDLPILELASGREQVAAVGARTFALSGVGGQGATASPGVLLDRSESGLQHTAPVGSLFVGGPLLTGSGRVVGVATLGYQPHDLDPGRVLSAPDITGLCASVLACAEDAIEDVDAAVNLLEPEGAPAPQPSTETTDAEIDPETADN